MTKHTILFLAANPVGTDWLALDEEARAIQEELERSGHRDRFEFVTRWAVRPLDLLRELRKLTPTIVHLSGHGRRSASGEPRGETGARRDAVGEASAVDGDDQHGLFFQGLDGRPQLVSTGALEATFGAAGGSVKLVVLSACYSEIEAEALLAHVDCVIGMSRSITNVAARNFAIGFYGGLGEGATVAAAYNQGRAAISLEGLFAADCPQLKVRERSDADMLILGKAQQSTMPSAPGTLATGQVKILFLVFGSLSERPKQTLAECVRVNDSTHSGTERLEWIEEWVESADEFVLLIARHRPDVIHVMSHVVQSEQSTCRKSLNISSKTIQSILRTSSTRLRCLFLSACDSDELAKAASNIVECSIGYVGALDDNTGAGFAELFYGMMALGCSVAEAYVGAVGQLPPTGTQASITESRDAHEYGLPASHAHRCRAESNSIW